VAFSSADQARAFVRTSETKWRACENQTVTMATDTKTEQWSFVGSSTGSTPKIFMEKVQADGGDRSCRHVLAAVCNVVIDVLACAPLSVKSPAGKFADQIAAKIPRYWPVDIQTWSGPRAKLLVGQDRKLGGRVAAGTSPARVDR
jgi:hypothetical protein